MTVYLAVDDDSNMLIPVPGDYCTECGEAGQLKNGYVLCKSCNKPVPTLATMSGR